VFLIVFGACKNNSSTKSPEEGSPEKKTIQIKYAEGFEIDAFDGFKTITLKNPWPGADKTFTYALVEKYGAVPNPEKFDAVVEIPVKRIVVTSTTHIPSLEMLGVNESLVGFPGLDFISSE